MLFLLHLISLVCLSIPLQLGYNLVLGKGKILHFGPHAPALAAAYGTFVLLPHIGYPLAVLCGVLCALVVSVFLWWLALRLEPDGLGVMSIAVHLALLSVVLNWTAVTRGALGIPQIPRMPLLETQLSFALWSMAIAALWVGFMYVLDRGPFGRRMAALAEQEWHAAGVGVRRWSVHLAAFLIAGLGAAITAMLYPQYVHLLHPSDFQFASLIFIVMVVVAGRPGSVLGVTLSAILLTLLREAIRFLPLSAALIGPLRLLIFGVILLIAVWIRRDVLFPVQRRV